MKIALFQIDPWHEKLFREGLEGNDLFIFREPLSEKNISLIKDAEIISLRARGQHLFLGGEIISQLPNLKFIAARSTGIDYIDVDLCKKKRISVSNISSYSEDSVAEHTFALILSIAKRLPFFIKNEDKSNYLQSLDLRGKTIGVVGTGKIGLKVISLAKSFGMNVLGYDIFKNIKASNELKFDYVPFETLLENSDFITLHLPLTPETRNIINEGTLQSMKSGVILINTARGSLINSKSLLKGLKMGIIQYAGLDMVGGEKEGLPLESQPTDVVKIKTHPRTIVTSHEAGNSKESRDLAVKLTVENIKSFINGSQVNKIC